MKLTLTMDMDNAAFRGDEGDDFPGHEAARILNRVAVSVAAGHGSGKLRDVNGNTVGSWDITDVADEDMCDCCKGRAGSVLRLGDWVCTACESYLGTHPAKAPARANEV